MDFQTLLNDKLVKTTQISAEDRVAEVRDRDAGDGIALLEGFGSALVGSYRNEFGKLIAVYEEGLLLDVIKARLRSERPKAIESELDVDAADLLGDLVRSFPYMGDDAGAPLIIEGLV